MAVSKRLWYEILRRDNHACRYCGATAPGVKLNVDHVIPTSLGGGDKPDNLVTACADCNGGKTSSMPNAEPVADVDQETFRQAAELKLDAERRREAISLHLYMVWIWAYEQTGRTPNKREQRWFMEETHKVLACGYSSRIDLTEPAYRAGLDNALDIQSYIKLPDTSASPEDERFVNSITPSRPGQRHGTAQPKRGIPSPAKSKSSLPPYTRPWTQATPALTSSTPRCKPANR
jgi:hypothetical protein